MELSVSLWVSSLFLCSVVLRYMHDAPSGDKHDEYAVLWCSCTIALVGLMLAMNLWIWKTE